MLSSTVARISRQSLFRCGSASPTASPRFVAAAAAAAATTTTTQSRIGGGGAMKVASFHASSTVMDDNLPYHIVVGLPALSPTMDSGSLAEWYVGEGDAISAGDAVAKIDTDKASMDFEAQDDVYVAKLLRTPENGADLAVGTPIMITVEDADDVAAFKDYVYKEDEAAAAPAPAAAAAPEPAPAAAPAPAAEPKEAKAAAAPAPPPPAAPPAPAPAPAAPSAPASSSSGSGDGQSMNLSWARPTSKSSPLNKSMTKQQEAYMKMYGTTGQKPVVAAEE